MPLSHIHTCTGHTYETRRANAANYEVYDRMYTIYTGLHSPLQNAFSQLALIARGK